MSLTWYVVRASGMIAFLLLTATVVIGLTMSSRTTSRRWPRFAVEDVHRFVSLLTWSFVAVHALALVADTYVPISVADLLVPGIAPYRPLPTALGVVALELLAALALANLLRRRISYAFWRRTHYLNFAVWILVFAHGITAGTDSDTLWGLAVYTTCAGLVGGFTAWRWLNRPGATGAAGDATPDAAALADGLRGLQR
jgi:predicted ferric reductase